MQTRMIAVAAIAGIILVGCAAPKKYVWKNYNHSDQLQFNKDAMQCEQYGAQVARTRMGSFAPVDFMEDLFFGPLVANARAATRECMSRLGYYQEEVR